MNIIEEMLRRLPGGNRVTPVPFFNQNYMKIIVECNQEVPNEFNYSEVEGRNRHIYNLAGDFELRMLFELGTIAPIEQEVTLRLFYEKSGEIKWAFKNAAELTDDVKEIVRNKLLSR
jgi:hypothetical protein